jgi:hypothetical protein
MKVSCKRMSIIFGVHLALASLYFSLYSFAECHKYDWNLDQQEYVCLDHLTATKDGKDFESTMNIQATSPIPPNPSTIPTPINIIQIILNVLSNSLLPLIPGSYMYTVQSLLVD